MSDEMKKLKKLLVDFLTEEEQAAELGKTTRTLASWRKQGKGPPYTFNGRQPLYKRDWTLQWLEAGKRMPPRSRRRADTPTTFSGTPPCKGSQRH